RNDRCERVRDDIRKPVPIATHLELSRDVHVGVFYQEH
ncbi:MAG: hypothetical protein RL169_834, partial [Armatimonadota bacterium]